MRKCSQELHCLNSRGKHAVCVLSHSVVSSSLRLYRLYPARILCSWNLPGKNTGAGYLFLLQRIFPTRDQTCISWSAALAGRFFTTWEALRQTCANVINKIGMGFSDIRDRIYLLFPKNWERLK